MPIKSSNSAVYTSNESKAESICEAQGVKFTPLRRMVYQIIDSSEKPIGAYAIMDALAELSEKEKIAPPTVYRCLDFFCSLGLVHKVHSQNSFFVCNHQNKDSFEAIFVCELCGSTDVIPSSTLQQAINLNANHRRFSVKHQALEILGECRDCATKR